LSAFSGKEAIERRKKKKSIAQQEGELFERRKHGSLTLSEPAHDKLSYKCRSKVFLLSLPRQLWRCEEILVVHMHTTCTVSV
jgi:hypothetical protein